MPHGRIYTSLESIANCIEWTGANIFQLINRPAQMLGITWIDEYTSNRIQDGTTKDTSLTWMFFIFSVISLICASCVVSLYVLAEPQHRQQEITLIFEVTVNRTQLFYFNMFLVFYQSFNCICLSKFVAFFVAKRVRHIKRKYFR